MRPIVGVGGVEQVEDAAQLAGNRLYWRVTWRVLALLVCCYVLAYVDRLNVAFAKLEMSRDLTITDTQYGLASGAFSIGYMLFELPSAWLLSRIGARRTIGRIMITWGVICCALAAIRTSEQFYLLRFLLGAAEAGFFPASLLLLSRWYEAPRRAAALSVFITAPIVAKIIAGPLAGTIMETMGGRLGLHGWQWLFILEGLPPILLGMVVLAFLEDLPSQATWLSSSERALLQPYEDASAAPSHAFKDALLSVRPYLYGLVYFALTFGSYALAFWVPSYIAAAGVQDLSVSGWLVAVPGVAMLIATLAVGRIPTNRTAWILVHFGGAVVSAAGFLLSAVSTGNLVVMVFALAIAAGGIAANQVTLWSRVLAEFHEGRTAVAVAMITTIGLAAGFLSPVVIGFMKDQTGSFESGLFVCCGMLLFNGIMAVVLNLATKAPRQ